MSFTNKIEEWMKEAEERPESAATIVRLVVRRLRELSERNEELLAENIALQNGTRVEEYQKRIVHLEYQLDMLKQRFGMDNAAMDNLPAQIDGTSTMNMLIYNAQGRIIRVELDAETREIGNITGNMITDHEAPRLLAVTSNENLLLLFTSGRVETYSVNNIPTMQLGGTWAWEQAAMPNEPHAGEQLACVVPFSHLPLSDFFLQVSRRGYTKKTLTSMSESILNNHFIGRGATQKSDQPFDLTLARKNDRAALVTYEGKVIAFDVEKLSYAAEERIRTQRVGLCHRVFHHPSRHVAALRDSNRQGDSARKQKHRSVEINFIKRAIADPAFAARTGNPLYGCGGGKRNRSNCNIGLIGKNQHSRCGSDDGQRIGRSRRVGSCPLG